VRREERWLLGFGVAVGAVLLGTALFGSRGIPEVRRLRAERDKVLAELRALKEEEDALWREIEDLRKNPRAIERLARENLGMIRRGEVIFLLPETDEPRR